MSNHQDLDMIKMTPDEATDQPAQGVYGQLVGMGGAPPEPSDIERTLRKYEEVIPPDKYIQILTTGNFANLQESECAKFLFIHAYRKGLDPWRQPFIFIVNKDGKRVLYARKEAAAQIRQNKGLTARLLYAGALRMEYTPLVRHEATTSGPSWKAELVPSKFDASIYETVWEAVNSQGIVVATDVGTADIGGVTGNERKNAIMSAYTRGKRRVILDAAGMADNDESEADPFENDEAMPRKRALPPGPRRTVPRAETPTDVPTISATTEELPSTDENGKMSFPPYEPSAVSTPTPVPMKVPTKPPTLPQA